MLNLSLLKNSFETLSKEAAPASCSKESTPATAPKAKEMPSIMAKFKKIDTTFVNTVKTHIRGLGSFECTNG